MKEQIQAEYGDGDTCCDCCEGTIKVSSAEGIEWFYDGEMVKLGAEHYLPICDNCGDYIYNQAIAELIEISLGAEFLAAKNKELK